MQNARQAFWGLGATAVVSHGRWPVAQAALGTVEARASESTPLVILGFWMRVILMAFMPLPLRHHHRLWEAKRLYRWVLTMLKFPPCAGLGHWL
jgi:hypothetical protein